MGTIELDAKEIVRKELDPVFVWLSFLVVVAALLAAPIFQHIFGIRALKRKMARSLGDDGGPPADHAIETSFDGGFDRDTQYEFDKLQRQLIDHERTIQSLAHERDEAYESLHAYDAELRRTQDALEANQVTLDAARDQAEGSHPLEQRCALLRQVLADMENYWLNPRASVEQCRVLLQDHAWVLEPEYIVDHLEANQALDRLMPSLFQRTATPLPGASGARSLRVDLCGWTNGVASLQPALASQERMLLLVHMMRPDETVTRGHIQDAYVMCTGVLNLAGNELWGATVDCLVIGGSVDDDVTDLHLRFGRDAHSAVRVIPVSYQQLYWRAQAMTQTMLGDDAEAYVAEPSTAPAAAAVEPLATQAPSPSDNAWQAEFPDLRTDHEDDSEGGEEDVDAAEAGFAARLPDELEPAADTLTETAETALAEDNDDLDIESAPSGGDTPEPAAAELAEKQERPHDSSKDASRDAAVAESDDTPQEAPAPPEKKNKLSKFSLRRNKPSAASMSADGMQDAGRQSEAQPLAASSNDNSPADKPRENEAKDKAENVETLPSKSPAKPQSKPADLLSLSQRLAKKSAENTGAPLKVAKKPKRWR